MPFVTIVLIVAVALIYGIIFAVSARDFDNNETGQESFGIGKIGRKPYNWEQDGTNH